MRTFVDTSALYALLDESDAKHRDAVEWLTTEGRDPNEILVSHNYVVVETAALVLKRLGPAASKVLFDSFLPALSVFYIDEHLHDRSSSAYRAGLKSAISLVDRVSFEVIRDQALDRAFAFDKHFRGEGFPTVP
jgi:uncharacterized protein